MNNFENAAQALNKKHYADSCGKTMMGQKAEGGYYHRPTALEEMEKSQKHNAEQLQLNNVGIEFLRANPAFNDFITLIRTGAISI